jgi:hypothetical protein
MLTLDQLISEATALPDADKALLIDKIVESMAGQVDSDLQTLYERGIFDRRSEKNSRTHF